MENLLGKSLVRRVETSPPDEWRDRSTWCGESILPGGFVVVQGLQHHVHGERKHTGQEDVEHKVEEEDETCEVKEKNRRHRDVR